MKRIGILVGSVLGITLGTLLGYFVIPQFF